MRRIVFLLMSGWMITASAMEPQSSSDTVERALAADAMELLAAATML